MAHPAIENQRAPAGPETLGWWVRDRRGRLSVAMWPNPAIWVWLAAEVLARTGLASGVSDATWRNVGSGALIVWAVDEIARGTSPFRRVLGALVLACQVAVLFS